MKEGRKEGRETTRQGRTNRAFHPPLGKQEREAEREGKAKNVCVREKEREKEILYRCVVRYGMYACTMYLQLRQM